MLPEYRALARAFLDDSLAALPSLAEPGLQDAYRRRIVALLGPLDLEEAVRLARQIPAHGASDELAGAWDELVRAAASNESAQTPALLREGLAMGAFRMETAPLLLGSLENNDAEAARSLYLAILTAYPAEGPSAADANYLLDRIAASGMLSPLASRAAAEKLLHALDAQKFSAADSGPLHARLEPLLQSYGGGSGDKPAASGDENEDARAASPGDSAANDVYRQINLAHDGSLPAEQRDTAARNALDLAAKLSSVRDRIAALGILGRDFALRGNARDSLRAASLLAGDYTRGCDSPDGRFLKNGVAGIQDCLNLAGFLAEYLDEFHFAPESLGPRGVSVDARLAVLELARQARR